TRRRDDWRPATVRRRGAAPVRALGLGVAVTVLLGGVAVAASTGVLDSAPTPAPPASASASPRYTDTAPDDRPTYGGTPTGPLVPELTPAAKRPDARRPATAKDETAHCRVYLASVRRKGEAPNGTAFERLEAAAGGPSRVEAYCAPRLGEDEKGDDKGEQDADDADDRTRRKKQ
ncbi:MAG TPA: hypothetical protein VIU94_33290, partial [Streptomyces sp.]